MFRPATRLRWYDQSLILSEVLHFACGGADPSQAVGRQTLGNIGGLIFAILVSASCLGVLNIDVYTTGILTVTSARRGYLPMILVGPTEEDLSTRRAQNPQSIQSVGTIGQIKSIVVTLFRFNRSNSPL